MRSSFPFLLPLTLGLVCTGLMGCSDADSSAAIQESEVLVAENDIAAAEVAGVNDDALAGQDAAATPSSEEADMSDQPAEAIETSNAGEAAGASNSTGNDVNAADDPATDSEEPQFPVSSESSETPAPKDRTKAEESEQASMVGPGLPPSLQWLTSWKDRDHDWVAGWKNVLNEIRRPLVLRPETPWPVPDSDNGIVNGNDSAGPVSKQASGKNEFAGISRNSSPPTVTKASETAVADSD